MAPKKDEPFTNFTFRFDTALRRKAEKIAKADDRPLGVWLHRLIAEKIAELEKAARKPPK